ncbi:Mov34/MPN/PAD-1 family protein [Deinococcus sp. HMF7604]|uniref:Mov34/MPN/PAD-1 family protein n=1 Tax=Deinococcus betulae TaxID=2873312 RepID=UPI001CD02114|nr:Mov34/MPN/PAD-1 family protein [Deinococcus betulae]MBZ9749740.1 Mov34/MPN/PAD-1 family protein [Deinococcus betulae]
MNLELPLPTGGTLTVTVAVLNTLWAFVQHQPDATEAGGMLIGHHPEATPGIILDRHTTPQQEDQRSRYRYHRDQAAHQVLLSMQWSLSGHTRTYVGEWHTHPEAVPTPSKLDRRSWKAALRETDFRGPGLVFIIIGTRRTRVWFGQKGQTTFPLLVEMPTGGQHGTQEETSS